MAKYCGNCGTEINDVQDICLKCGVSVNNYTHSPEAKSKVAGGLLALFFGYLGVHNFYLGYTGKAVTQLLLYIFGIPLCFVFVGIPMVLGVSIWSFVEAIMIFAGTINKDAKGNLLKD